jgi:VWFA-related protein
MKGAVDAVKAGAKQFISALRPQDRLSLVTFSDEATLVHDLTVRRDSTIKAVDEYTIRGGTALYDALFDSLNRLESVEGRRAIVVLTDGRDENNAGNGPGSRHSFDEVLAQLSKVDATVYTIGLGGNVEGSVLERVAQISGGEAFFPSVVEELEGDYRRVVEHLRRRYVATYISSNPRRDGKWRAVEIAAGPNATVRSRGGYHAPNQ